MPQIRITIYRCPAYSSRALRYFEAHEDDAEAGQVRRIRFIGENLGEEVYTWETDVDIWGGIINFEVRNELHEKIRSFDGSLDNRKSGVQRLHELISKFEEGVSQGDAWVTTPLESPVSITGEARPIRIPSSLAFVNHLRWICETFQGIPDLVAVIG